MCAKPFLHSHFRNAAVSASQPVPKSTPAQSHTESMIIILYWKKTCVYTDRRRRLLSQRTETWFRGKHCWSLTLSWVAHRGVSNCDWGRTNAATEVWQTEPWMLRRTCDPPFLCIPSISLALMAEHVLRRQQETALKMSWSEILDVWGVF